MEQLRHIYTTDESAGCKRAVADPGRGVAGGWDTFLQSPLNTNVALLLVHRL